MSQTAPPVQAPRIYPNASDACSQLAIQLAIQLARTPLVLKDRSARFLVSNVQFECHLFRKMQQNAQKAELQR
jgi:hypothetical protein